MGKSIQSRRPPPDLQNRSFRSMIEFGTRRTATSGYMSYSDRVGPSVILLHEFFGLQQSFKSYADLLNEQGFTVLAPDLYDGEIADSVDSASAKARSLDGDRTMEKIKAAAEHLTENWHPRLGVVGFSLGAGFAIELAQELPIEGTVLYYGLGDFDPGRWHGPCLGHFAEDDEWESVADAETAFDGLREGGIEAEMYLYPKVGHWFANADMPSAYDETAAQLAFQRTVEFFQYHLS
ncbi:MAG: carboxymethylenebutenolidase [Actinomycetota bacterium]|jgi:carboxymethylenebutenolidase|nr:carboxymethylenebutenolidase [Actinomycetota bacterium]